MHYNALYAIKHFVKKYLNVDDKLRILDVGSYSTSRPAKDLIFRRYFRDNKNWEFIGMDLVAGNNVDIVSDYPYNYPFEDNEFDIVISGNTLEHVKDTHKFIKELNRITNNLLCVIVPNRRPEHKYPVDCWRVFPDGMRFLCEEIVDMYILECRLYNEDTICVAKKKIL